MPRKQNPDPMSAQQQQEMVSEGMENFELPKSVVMKIAKSAIPDDARLTKETVLSLVKGSTVFINYLAAMAHDVAQGKQHKSIAASDVLRALELMDFGDLVQPLQSELQLYKDTGKPSGRKSSSAANGSKGLSISIPASSASASANGAPNTIRMPASNTKLMLTVPGKPTATLANGDKGKGKAVDADGDEIMGVDSNQEVLGGDIRDEGMEDDEDELQEETQDVDEEDEELAESDDQMEPPDSPSVGGASEHAPS